MRRTQCRLEVCRTSVELVQRPHVDLSAVGGGRRAKLPEGRVVRARGNVFQIGVGLDESVQYK
jgi:hypothetical protein